MGTDKTSKADEAISKLQDIFNFVGLPKVVVSDNGPPFSSWVFTKWRNDQDNNLLHSPASHPQSNSLAARTVQDVKNLLKKD